MFRPGDVVTVRFRGAARVKVRPGVVVSTDLYQATRADLIVAILTTRLDEASGTCGGGQYRIQVDPKGGGTPEAGNCPILENIVGRPLGHLSDRDWLEIQTRLRLGIAVP